MTELEPNLSGEYLNRYGPRALILGGSEGVGAAFAQHLAAAGFDLTLVARDASKLETAAKNIRSSHDVDVDWQTIDLSATDSRVKSAELVSSREYGLVIYNAGATHGGALFLDKPVEHATKLVALNCGTTIAVAHAALSKMQERGRGGLIIVSSMSGLVGGGFVAAYGATKSFQITLAEGLHWEMSRKGVDVMGAVLGLTDTPSMVRSGMDLSADPNLIAMSSDDAAAGALEYLGKGAVWFANGEDAASAIRSAPRALVSDAMSRTTARLYGIAVDCDQPALR